MMQGRYRRDEVERLRFEVVCEEVAASGLPAGAEVRGQLRQVRRAQTGSRVVDVTSGAGVVQVVVSCPGLVKGRERRPRPGREPLDGRFPEAGPVPEVRVDHRCGPVQLRSHETGAAPALLDVTEAGREAAEILFVSGVRVGVGDQVGNGSTVSVADDPPPRGAGRGPAAPPPPTPRRAPVPTARSTAPRPT